MIEAFVTPSGLPTAARIGIGVLAEAAFLAYVIVFGRRGGRLGFRGGAAADSRLGHRTTIDRSSEAPPRPRGSAGSAALRREG